VWFGERERERETERQREGISLTTLSFQDYIASVVGE
jgi:hypothetical protein